MTEAMAPAATPAAPSTSVDRGVAARWTPKLGVKFCAVSSFFLANYHRLHEGHEPKPLYPTEVLVIIHLIDHKWDARAPFPTVGLLAKRMSLSERAVRDATRSLEQRGLLRRESAVYSGPNRYHLEPLFERLEAMMEADAPTAVVAPPSVEAAA